MCICVNRSECRGWQKVCEFACSWSCSANRFWLWAIFKRPSAVSYACASVLQCVALCRSVLQRAAACCSVLQRVAACCSVLQRVAVYCSVLQCVSEAARQTSSNCELPSKGHQLKAMRVAVRCNVRQCVAACCSVFLKLLGKSLQTVSYFQEAMSSKACVW